MTTSTKTIPIVPESRLPVEKSWDIAPEVVKSDVQEVVISLFGECNLRCVFCYDAERFDERATVAGIMRRLALFKEAMVHITRPKIDVKVFGGELFQDKFRDDIWDAYDQFFIGLEESAKVYGKELNIYVATNLQYTDISTNKVLDLITRHAIKVRGSFDFVGRFTKESQVARFWKNASWLFLSDIPIELAFVATKPNIEAILHPSDDLAHQIFEWFYNYSKVQFDFYNDVGVDGYTVSEMELFEFFKFLHLHYPKISTVAERVRNFNDGYTNYRYCNRGIWIDRIIQPSCCDFKAKTEEFIRNKGCLTCEHFTYCTGSCVRVFASESECWIRKFFDWLKDGKENNSDRE